MSFISLEGVGFTYPESSRAALKDISVSIGEGEHVAIVGRNGSGKSTLLRLLDGLRTPTQGRVEVFGLCTGDGSNLPAIRSGLSLVFQAPVDQIVSSVVEEDVAFGPENLGLPRAEIKGRVDKALRAVGLEAERKSPSLFLSAGQQQRLAIAGALAMEPRCIAFDEATAMLDPEARKDLLGRIDELNAQGMAIIHATHDMSEAARASRILALEDGRLVFDGLPGDFFFPGGSGLPAPAERLGFGLPPALRLCRELGIEPRLGESLERLAARIAASGAAIGDAYGAASMSHNDGASHEAPRPAPGEAGDPVGPAFALEEAGHSWLRGTANERVALRGVSVCLQPSSLVAVVGRTGSGKSTLLQLLDALAFPTGGRVIAFGQDTLAKGTDLRSLRMRAPLCVQRPEAALFEPYAADDVAFGPRNQGLAGKALVARVREAMDKAGLDYDLFRDRGSRGLSGGEKRKLALAGVLALDSEALLLDEPTSALDPETREAVMALLAGHAASGRTVVFATHSMEEASRADLVLVMRGAELVASLPPRELFHSAYDPAWGIARPFAAAMAIALAATGIEIQGQPLTLGELVSGLKGSLAGDGGRAKEGAG